MEQEDPTAAAGRARGRCRAVWRQGRVGRLWEEHGGSTKWILYVCSRKYWFVIFRLIGSSDFVSVTKSGSSDFVSVTKSGSSDFVSVTK
jgi:hypothetical protein